MNIPYSSIETRILSVKNKKIVAVKIDLPHASPLILVKGDQGFIMCGYLNIDVAEKLGLIAARVTGVRDIDEFLRKEIAETTSSAEKHGIRRGMKVRDALELL